MPNLTDPSAPPAPLQRVAAGVLAAVLLAALLGCAPAGGELQTYLLPLDAALPEGAVVVERLPLADAVLVNGSQIPARGVAAATPLGFTRLAALPRADGLHLDSGVLATGADEVWASGNRGQGAVVALIDSGVAPLAALQGAVVGEIDFSGTGGGDPYGHGTFMASLIAGRGPVAPGVAPSAGILSLKVGDAEGGANLGAVIAALQWLDGPGRSTGLRIATLALGVEPGTPAAALLDRATDRLAERGVLVVTAAGNEGPTVLTAPATATRTFSVGAFDDADPGVTPMAAAFSGSGPDRAGISQPDALAAGVSLTGHLDPASVIGTANADAMDGTLLRGTGTSMATGLAAGVAALAQTARPDLGGVALDLALRNDARVIDAPDAVETILAAPTDPSARAPGQAGQGRAHDPPAAANGRGPSAAPGRSDAIGGPGGLRWERARWTGVRWTIARWRDVSWSIARWRGEMWTIARWRTERWEGSEADLTIARWRGVWAMLDTR
jgi:serine protease AprX